jgi:ATP-dependent DNA ligase
MKAKSTQKTMESYFFKKKESSSLTIDKVFDTFIRISRCKGNNSATEKENIILKLLMDSKDE